MARATVQLSDQQLDIVRFCAIECELQMSGERSVEWMIRAWMWALRHTSERVVEEHVLALGLQVEPDKNLKGYRQVGVRVGADVKQQWWTVAESMTGLLGSTVGPEEWFRQYEEIHPFRDGNGRTGAILYNWRRDTLHAPEWPPNFWNDQRRTPHHGAPAGAGDADG